MRQEQLLNIGIAFVLLAVYSLVPGVFARDSSTSFASLEQAGDSSRKSGVHCGKPSAGV